MDIALLCLLAGGLITGFSKFSVGGMGLLILPVLMVAFPGPDVLGIIIPMYIITDVLAICSYRKHIDWAVLWRFLPLTLVGTLVGAWLLSDLSPDQFKWWLGGMILAMLLLSVLLDHHETTFMQTPAAGKITGAVIGFVSMISNAAGPLVSLYLMAQGLSKERYISTRVWGFFILNLAKLPILWQLQLLNQDTLLLSLKTLPGLLIGAYIGYRVINRLNIQHVKWLIRGMATIAAIRLLVF